MPSVSNVRRIVVLLACVMAISGGGSLSQAEPLLSGIYVALGQEVQVTESGDFNADGFTDLVGVNRLGQLQVYPGSADLSFDSPSYYVELAQPPRITAVADVDGDRRQDLVLGTITGIKVLLNAGRGSFAGPYSITSGSVDGLQVGDFDSDGTVDFATSRNSAPGFAVTVIFMRANDPYFGVAKQVTLTPGLAPVSLASADFDGDGDLDLAAVNQCESLICYNGSVSVHLNQGARVFAPPRSFTVGVTPTILKSDDFNEDGRPDLVIGQSGPGHLSVLLGKGDGTFENEVQFPAVVHVPPGPQSVKVGDWNLDGHADLAVSGAVNPGTGSSFLFDVAVLDGRGDGTFAPSRIYGASLAGVGLAAGDFNGDGNPDFAIRSSVGEGGGIVLLPGDGHGGFAGLQGFDVGGSGGSFVKDVVAADFNRDGRRDLIVANPALTVLLAGPDGKFAPLPAFLPGYGANGVAVGDFNQDGIPDLALAVVTSGISILPGNGDGTFQAGTTFPILDPARDIIVDDFDADGRDDVAALGIYVSVLRGQGGGMLGPEETYIACSSPQSLVPGDFYIDGRTDIAVRCTSSIVILSNAGDFFASPFETVTGYLSGMTHADFDADGKEDLAVIGRSVSLGYLYLQVLLGNGDATFSSQPSLLPSGESMVSIAAADFNADGRMDLSIGVDGLFGSPSLSYVPRSRLYLGRGNGQLDAGDTVLAIPAPYHMLAEDLDADGRPDLTVAGSYFNSQYVSLLVSRNIGPLPDADGDGVLNPADPCTDADGDGFGDPGFAANACPADNCRDVPNPSQADGDTDGIGDACDRCHDGDQDEAGDPGFPQDVCPADNCPDLPNLSQADFDRDGLGDACDPCTDPDGDGFGEPGNACGEDNCPGVSNPDQADRDGDRFGDACDPCPLDPLNDADGDFVCGDVDNCPDSFPDQTDTDGDRVGDHCDNCPTVPNADQADTSTDGSGDACQPSLILSGIRSDGGGTIEVDVDAGDPQGEPLSGRVEVIEIQAQTLTLRDLLASGDCSQGWFPQSHPGEGIGFLFGSIGIAVVADFYNAATATGLACDVNFLGRYHVCPGSCAASGQFNCGQDALFLGNLPLPAPICVTNQFEPALRFDATIESFDPGSLTLSFNETRILSVPFDDGLPAVIDISSLSVGPDHRLRITATDGNTVPVTVESPFDYQGESTMLFGGHAPTAVIAPPGPVECDRLEGGFVSLDGSGSDDPDSTPGTNDDIVRFEWFEDFDTVETPLGEGEMLSVTLPLGAHAITLRVTDTAGLQDLQTVTVEVVDTQGPVIDCPALTSAECSGPEGAFVAVVATGRDACAGPVPLANDRTSGGADASRTYPLGATIVGFSGSDASGNGSSCESRVVVLDTTPPTLEITAEPRVLWPPNHRLVTVGIRWQAVDRCDSAPSVILAGATSSEPDDAPGSGDGATTGDIAGADLGLPDAEMMLRAERSTSGAGRTYDLEYAATDDSGNRGLGLATVLVPHDLGSGPEPLQQRLQSLGIPGRVQVVWNTVENAQRYDLIQGRLENLAARDGHVSLGHVRLLMPGPSQTTWGESAGEEQPASGRAFFYLVQYHDSGGPSGWGTESSSLPQIPDAVISPAVVSGGGEPRVK